MSGPTIIVEDGSIVVGANSYLAVSDVAAYASNRNVTLPADATVAGYLIAAMDWIEGNADKWQGDLVQNGLTDMDGNGNVLPAQPLSWPRKNRWYNCRTPYPSNVIPTQLKTALCMLVLAIVNGYNPLVNGKEDDFILSEKAGIYSTVYVNPLSVGMLTQIAPIINVLKPLFASAKGPFQIRTDRA